MIDKHEAMLNYLFTCPTVLSNPLFFNFGEMKENSNQFITTSNSETYGTEYVDGSITKFYVFTLLTFKTISYNAIVKTEGTGTYTYTDENLLELTEFQDVIDWINEQEDAHNYPDFGENCVVDSIKCMTANPVVSDVDTSQEPAIATYSITIQVEYLDNSKRLWK